MKLFSIPNAARDEARVTRKIRIGYGSLLLILSLTAAAGVGYGDRLSAAASHVLALIAYGVIAASLAGAYIIPQLAATSRRRKEIRFEISDSGLTKHLVDWPDKYIAFSDIAAIHETNKYLQVRGKDEFSWIAIPRDIENYESLRRELERYCPVTENKKSVLAIDFLSLAPFICAWVIFYQSTDQTVVKWAGIIGLLILAEQFYWISQWFVRKRYRFVGWFAMAALWFRCAWSVLNAIKPRG